ncbi:MAG: hypothetical protein KGL12_07365 [Rhodospirillales bacterium]|nr:hypothetical protein [Rhodospirillales bacterium]
MRRLAFRTLVASVLLAQPALAACVSPQEQPVFDVAALRSQLMVLATSCHDNSAYDAFIRRYQPDLMANERSVDAYFKRIYGRAAQREHDTFVTDLANAQSDQGLNMGTDFCPRDAALFSEVMALQSASQLPAYAAGKDLIPASMHLCEDIAPRKAVVRHVPVKKKR